MLHKTTMAPRAELHLGKWYRHNFDTMYACTCYHGCTGTKMTNLTLYMFAF